MSDRSNDEVAKALERLAAGQAEEPQAPSADVSHAEPAPVSPAAGGGRPVIPQRPPGTGATPKPKPVRGRSTAAASSPSRPLQPPGSAAPPPPRPVGAPAAEAPPPAARSGATPRPAPPGPARPAAPLNPAQLQVETQAIEDDDRVIVPAPSTEVFLHHGTGAKSGGQAGGRLSLRRTLIPILLTSGLILFLLGLLRFLWTDNNPLAGLQPWLVAVMFVFALVLWGLAALNMIAVKHQLASQGQ